MEIAAGQRLVLLAILAVALMALAVGILYRMRVTPSERERRRRLRLNLLGRLGDAMITDVQGGVVFYTYKVGGVAYHASQDVTGLSGNVPTEDALLLGSAYIKYLPRNPANSIVISEQWSGLRVRTDPVPAPMLRADREHA